MMHPSADLRKVITFPFSGADPVMTNLTLPPTFLLTHQKINLSQTEFFRTIPL